MEGDPQTEDSRVDEYLIGLIGGLLVTDSQEDPIVPNLQSDRGVKSHRTLGEVRVDRRSSN